MNFDIYSYLISHKVSPDTIFTTIITISIFFVGALANRLYDRYKRFLELKRQKKYFIFLVSKINKPLLNQCDYFISFSKSIKNRKSGNLFLRKELIAELETLKDIKHSDLYEVYRRKKFLLFNKNWESYLQKYHHSISMINYIYLNYGERFNQYSTSQSKFESLWQENLSFIVRYFDQLISENVANKIKRGEDNFLEEFNYLLSEVSKVEGHKEPKKNMKLFIEPLNAICKKYIGDHRAVKMLEYSIKCKEAYMNMENVNNSYRRYFLEISRKLIHANFELKESINFLS